MPVSGGISAVLPVYRAEPGALRNAVACLRGQTVRELEILLVLNGADAATVRLAHELAGVDRRIRVIELAEAGLAGALNAGLRAASHPLAARMDADDTCALDRFERQAAFMRSNPGVVALGTAFDGVDERGARLGVERPPTDPRDVRWRLLLGNVHCHGSMMLRREQVLNAGGYDVGCGFAQDYDLWLRLSRGHDLANLPDVLYHYTATMERRHTEQARIAAAKMVEAWALLAQAEEAVRAEIATHVARAQWGGHAAREALAAIEEHLRERGPTREGLLARQWIAGRAGRLADPRLSRLREAGRGLVRAGVQQVWLYGAGRHTAWLIDNADELGVEIAGIADDDLAGTERYGMVVRAPPEVPDDAEALISSDSQESRLWEASLPMRARGVRVWGIYGRYSEQAPAAASSGS
jgi:hypothetical protein